LASERDGRKPYCGEERDTIETPHPTQC
jgi:hypothetical protein